MKQNGTTMRHVGQMIKAELDRQPKAHTVTWFAGQLHCKRTNVYNIFNRSSIDTALLERISCILNHDFFLDLSVGLNESAKTKKARGSLKKAPLLLPE